MTLDQPWPNHYKKRLSVFSKLCFVLLGTCLFYFDGWISVLRPTLAPRSGILFTLLIEPYLAWFLCMELILVIEMLVKLASASPFLISFSSIVFLLAWLVFTFWKDALEDNPGKITRQLFVCTLSWSIDESLDDETTLESFSSPIETSFSVN